MAKKSLMQAILEYGRATGNFDMPTTVQEQDIYSSIFKQENISKEPLDISELQSLLIEDRVGKVSSFIQMCRKIAKGLEVECVGHENNLKNDEVNINIEGGTNDNNTFTYGDEDGVAENKEYIDVTLTFDEDKEAHGLFYVSSRLITLLSGSDARENYTENVKSVKSNRTKYGKLIRDSKLTRNIEGLTPSAAAMVIVGRTANGWTEWKDNEGNSIDIYRDSDYYTDIVESDSIKLENIVDEVEQEAGEGMQSDTETMQIPKISLSDTTIRGLQGISEETVNKLIDAMNGIKDTPKETKEKMIVQDSGGVYTEEERNDDVIGIPFNKVKNAVQRGMNVIYRGVPGCGKTYAAKCDAKAIIGFKESNRIKQIDFTENLGYSDTMVGLRQQENGRWQYIKGEIAEFCDFASQNSDSVFVLILNEFTRANTEAVLGQMFTAMENKYRGDKFILDSGDKFICPKNLVILATMNGTDRGVKKLDKATEERFYIIDVEPLWSIWAKGEDDFVELLIKLDIYSGTEEERIVRDICVQMNEINKKCLDGGILTIDSQIGQRQLMQFIGQNDISGNKIKYDKETLDIVIEQLINRATPMIDMCNSIEVNIEKLKKLVV